MLAALTNHLQRKYEVTRCISGSAVGGDTWFALMCLELFYEADHHICVPDYAHNDLLVEYMQFRYNQDKKDGAKNTKITIHDTGLPPLERDDYMLDLYVPSVLYAFPSTKWEQVRGSGTWATIRHARKREMQIFVFPLNGDKTWSENT